MSSTATGSSRRYKPRFFSAALVSFGWWCSCAAAGEPSPDHVFPDGVEVHFLSADEGASAIIDDTADPFFEKLTLLDITLRLGRELQNADLQREQAQFKELVGQSVQEWTPEEEHALLSVLKRAHVKCQAVVPSLIPKKWRFIKTDGRATPASHTRGSCVVLTKAGLAEEVLEKIIIHETFHVYSRLNPKRREQLYRSIGFRHLGDVPLPSSLESKRLTNPDGIDFAWAITVRDARRRELQVIPVTYSRYDALQERITDFFQYVTFGFFEVRREGNSWVVVTDEKGQARAIEPIQGLFEQIGLNTQYILHPDEILADNVALLVLSKAGDESEAVRSPEVLSNIERILNAK